MGDLVRLVAKVNNTYTVYIKDGRLIKQPRNGKCVVIMEKSKINREGIETENNIYGEDVPFSSVSFVFFCLHIAWHLSLKDDFIDRLG